MGEVQGVKQPSLVRVTGQRPAATSVTAEAKASGPVKDPRSPKALSARRAATPNPPQTKKYGAMNRAVAASSAGFVGRPASRRVIPRYATIIGKADGNIIATIMTTRRAKQRMRSVDRKREGAVSAIRASAEVHGADQAAPTARATAAATGTVRCRRSQAGSAGTVSTMPQSERVVPI